MRPFPPETAVDAVELLIRAWHHLRQQDSGWNYETLESRQILIDIVNQVELGQVEAIDVS